MSEESPALRALQLAENARYQMHDMAAYERLNRVFLRRHFADLEQAVEQQRELNRQHQAKLATEDRSLEAKWLRETDETRAEANWRPGQE